MQIYVMSHKSRYEDAVHFVFNFVMADVNIHNLKRNKIGFVKVLYLNAVSKKIDQASKDPALRFLYMSQLSNLVKRFVYSSSIVM